MKQFSAADQLQSSDRSRDNLLKARNEQIKPLSVSTNNYGMKNNDGNRIGQSNFGNNLRSNDGFHDLNSDAGNVHNFINGGGRERSPASRDVSMSPIPTARSRSPLRRHNLTYAMGNNYNLGRY